MAGPTPQTPNPSFLGKGDAELSLQGLYIPLSFWQFEVCSHLLCQEALSSWGECREMLKGKGPSAWENTHPHARTCFHSEKCALDPWENKFPDSTGMHGSPVPLAWILCLSSVEGEAYPAERASPDLCHGGLTCSAGVDEGVREWVAMVSSIHSRYHPWLSGGQGSLYVTTCEHTTSRVSMG